MEGITYIYLVSHSVVRIVRNCMQDYYVFLHKVDLGCIQVANSIEYDRHGFKKQAWVSTVLFIFLSPPLKSYVVKWPQEK